MLYLEVRQSCGQWYKGSCLVTTLSHSSVLVDNLCELSVVPRVAAVRGFVHFLLLTPQTWPPLSPHHVQAGKVKPASFHLLLLDRPFPP